MTDPTPDRYRKLPVEIEAVQLSRDNFRKAVRFVPIEQFGAAGDDEEGRVYVDIRTLEGTMRASEGDWIIRGVKGEHYPCKPDVFGQTYEPAAAAAVSVAVPPTVERRQRIIEALYEARRPGLGGMSEAEAVAYMADAVLAVADTEQAELRAEVERLGGWYRTISARATTAEADRDRIADELAVNEADRVAAVTRTKQAEELLTVAHETSNRSEAERASAVQRAERAEAEVERLRAELAEEVRKHNNTIAVAAGRTVDAEESLAETARLRAEQATIRAAALHEAADVAERVAVKRHEQHEIEREQGALDVMTALRRMADEEQQPETYSVAEPSGGMDVDEEYAVDIDEDGLPFARILFAFPASVPAEKRMALAHGITRAVHGARFGADMAAAEEQPDSEQGCAQHCGGPHAWDDCETYTALVAEGQPENETPDEEPREPHPTEADLHHALAVLARFQGRDAAPPAVVSQPDEEA